VSEDALDKRQARSRWKQYAALGYKLTSHNLQAKAEA
jgi:DNA polymerase IIIc chi subunit